jgi:DNA-binding IclR family transcriptional regulator
MCQYLAIVTTIRQLASPPEASPPTSRAVAVVDFLAMRPGEAFTVSEIARGLGINRSTGRAILRTLADAGWVQSHRPGSYTLGAALIAVGESARAGLRVLDEARAEIEPLAQRLGLETMAAIPTGDRLVVAVTAGGDELHRIGRVGQTLPIAPPFAMVVVAFGPDDALEAWLDRAATSLTGSERDHYRGAVAAVRARGYSATLDIETRRRLGEALAELARHPASIEARRRRDDLIAALAHDRYVLGDLPGAPVLPISQISAPVFDGAGTVAMVLGVQGFPHQLAVDQLAELAARIVDTAGRITTRIGGHPPAAFPRAGPRMPDRLVHRA